MKPHEERIRQLGHRLDRFLAGTGCKQKEGIAALCMLLMASLQKGEEDPRLVAIFSAAHDILAELAGLFIDACEPEGPPQ